MIAKQVIKAQLARLRTSTILIRFYSKRCGRQANCSVAG
jgi:hypothetical protein